MRISDWSSDVCSSDLREPLGPVALGAGFRDIDDAAVEIGAFTRQAGIDHIGAFVRRAAPVGGRDDEALPRQFVAREHVVEVAADRERAIAIGADIALRSEAHTSELQSLIRTSYDV